MAKGLTGVFITFEGPEGSGKSTQSKLLCSFLKKRGYSILHFREPGDTRLSEAIRKILLDSKNTDISAKAEMFLYMASRANLVFNKILPALKKGKIVVCDRFALATLVYQGYGLGVDKKLINKLNDFATEGIKPNITFLLDVNVKTGIMRSSRTKGFKDRIEKRSLIFHNKVRKGYLSVARKNPKKIKVFSSDKNNKHQTQKLIQREVLNVISRHHS